MEKKTKVNEYTETAKAALLETNYNDKAVNKTLRDEYGIQHQIAKKYIDYARKALFSNDKEALKELMFQHLEDYNEIAEVSKEDKQYKTVLAARAAAEKLLHLHAPETFIQIFNTSGSIFDLENVPDDVLKNYIAAEEQIKKIIDE